MSKIQFLTAGESHGKGLLGIIQGIPSGLSINKEYINFQLSRRQKGYGRGGRMKIEKDQVKIYSGIRSSLTLGSPIGLLIDNLDWKNWQNIMSIENVDSNVKKITLPRPGHADLAGAMKYDFDDIRNVIERSSARETTMRVALGSICRKLLEECNIFVGSYVTAIHNVTDHNIYDYDAQKINEIADKSNVRSLDKIIENKMVETIKNAQQNKDSVGGKFQIVVSGVPYGLGSYSSWDLKLNSKLTQALSSINAIKSVDIGYNASSETFGSEMHDEIGFKKDKFFRYKNNAGGIEGGMSNAQPIIVNVSMKPLSTLSRPLKSVDLITKNEAKAHKERTDSCAVPAASVIGESMVCIVIADLILNKFGGDSMKQLLSHLKQSAKY